MKPTKMRNKRIYRATNQVVNKQISAPLSQDLRKKYSRRSVRIMVDDTAKVIRGEYKGITGKVSKISINKSSIAIEGNKKEKLRGEKIDVYIHSSNVVVTSLNTGDKWRIKILEKKPKSKIKSIKRKMMLNQQLKRKMMLNQQLKRKMMLNQQLKRKMMLNQQLKRKMMLNQQLKRKMMLNQQLKRKMMLKRV